MTLGGFGFGGMVVMATAMMAPTRSTSSSSAVRSKQRAARPSSNGTGSELLRHLRNTSGAKADEKLYSSTKTTEMGADVPKWVGVGVNQMVFPDWYKMLTTSVIEPRNSQYDSAFREHMGRAKARLAKDVPASLLSGNLKAVKRILNQVTVDAGRTVLPGSDGLLPEGDPGDPIDWDEALADRAELFQLQATAEYESAHARVEEHRLTPIKHYHLLMQYLDGEHHDKPALQAAAEAEHPEDYAARLAYVLEQLEGHEGSRDSLAVAQYYSWERSTLLTGVAECTHTFSKRAREAHIAIPTQNKDY